MKNTPTTYSLLVRSEEKGRTLFEGAIIGLIVLSTAFTGWQFAANSVVLPGMNRANNDSKTAVEMVAKAPVDQPLVASRG